MNIQAEGRSPGATDYGARSTSQRKPPTGPRLDADGRWLVVPLGGPHVVTGWTLVGGSLIGATKVAWRFVAKGDLAPELDARAWLCGELRERFEGRADLPCFLTARRLDHFEETVAKVEGHRVRVIATVGLSNALAAGDAPGPLEKRRIGTINILVVADRPVSAEARLEALTIATEAKVLALLEAGVRSRRAGGGERPATGTGTDCALIAAPTGHGPNERGLLTAAGKHTPFGAAIGAAVFDAVSSGTKVWLESFGSPRA